jgi:hypothetical protein
MEWLIKKGDIMAEVEESEFFERLESMKKEQMLVFVIEGPNIDVIIQKDGREYDYWDMVGTVFLDTQAPEELEQQRNHYKAKLVSIGIENGGSYEGEVTMNKNNEEKKRKVAERLDETLREGNMEAPPTDEAARDRLIPKVEIRIQAETDPIREETRQIKKVIIEKDERYNAYDRE